MRPHIEFLFPESLDEACRLLAEAGPDGLAMAGGTDLIPKMKAGTRRPERVVGLKRIPGLDRIRLSSQGELSVGATALLADVAGSELIAYRLPAITEAAAETGTPQVRNMGTVVGNLCNAAPSADNAPCLVALGAGVVVGGLAAGAAEVRRRIPLTEFFQGPGSTALGPGEIVTEVVVRIPQHGTGLAYKNLSARGRVDIAAAGVAALVRVEDGVCREATIVLGGVAPVPLPVPDAAEPLVGTELDPERLAAAAARAAAACSPISDVRASADYRRHLVAVLTERALVQACERASAPAAGDEGRRA